MGKRIITITPEMLAQLVQLPGDGGEIFYRHIDNRHRLTRVTYLPRDLRGLRCGIDEAGRVCLVVESEYWEEHQPPQMIPPLEIEYSDTDLGPGPFLPESAESG